MNYNSEELEIIDGKNDFLKSIFKSLESQYDVLIDYYYGHIIINSKNSKRWALTDDQYQEWYGAILAFERRENKDRLKGCDFSRSWHGTYNKHEVLQELINKPSEAYLQAGFKFQFEPIYSYKPNDLAKYIKGFCKRFNKVMSIGVSRTALKKTNPHWFKKELRKYERDYILDYYMKKFLHIKGGLNTAEYCGSGAFAVAFKYRNKVIKITSDVNDYQNSFTLKGTKNKYLAKIFDVKVFECKGEKHYVIVTEYCGKAAGKEGRCKRNDEQYDNYWAETNSLMDLVRHYFYKGYHNDFKTIEIDPEYLPDYSSQEPYVEKLTPMVLEYLKELSVLKMRSSDFHEDNFSWQKKGGFKLFDFGISSQDFPESHFKKFTIQLTEQQIYK